VRLKGFRVQRFKGSGFRGSKVQGSEVQIRVRGSGFKGLGFGVQSSGFKGYNRGYCSMFWIRPDEVDALLVNTHPKCSPRTIMEP
jgi:hypothetical protein